MQLLTQHLYSTCSLVSSHHPVLDPFALPVWPRPRPLHPTSPAPPHLPSLSSPAPFTLARPHPLYPPCPAPPLYPPCPAPPPLPSPTPFPSANHPSVVCIYDFVLSLVCLVGRLVAFCFRSNMSEIMHSCPFPPDLFHVV